jgi:cobalt-zinc-cadmium efflux system protein
MTILSGFRLNSEQSKSLAISIVLTGLIFIVEVAGGFLTNSLALLSDAAHVLADFVSLALALLAIMLAAFPATDTRTYGWHRSEVFAALINGVTLIAISGVILYEAYGRLMEPEEVRSIPMLVVAAFGLVVNLIVIFKLKGHGEHDLNMRSAFLHVLGDALVSVGVIAGGITMHLTGWYLVDPILSIIFSVVILKGAVRVLYESAHILLEGTPRGMEVSDVSSEIKKAEHVRDVHRLHVWSICSNITALSAHVLIDEGFEGRRKEIIKDINCRLVSRFHIHHTTLQLERTPCEGEALVCSLSHCDPASGECAYNSEDGHGNHEHHGHHHGHAH